MTMLNTTQKKVPKASNAMHPHGKHPDDVFVSVHEASQACDKHTWAMSATHSASPQ